MHEVNYNLELSQEAGSMRFYNDCLKGWSIGAVNVNGLISSLYEAKNRLGIDLNTDPGARLLFCQIGALLRLDGIGGCSEDMTKLEKEVSRLGGQ